MPTELYITRMIQYVRIYYYCVYRNLHYITETKWTIVQNILYYFYNIVSTTSLAKNIISKTQSFAPVGHQH